jgi:hypothetical protein
MKTKLTAVISVLAVTLLALAMSNTVKAQGADTRTGKPSGGGVIVATPITPQEAAKKYPAPNGKYPTGERDPHRPSGIVSSPYPPHTEFDCSKVAHGGLVVDTHANKVFVRP